MDDANPTPWDIHHECHSNNTSNKGIRCHGVMSKGEKAPILKCPRCQELLFRDALRISLCLLCGYEDYTNYDKKKSSGGRRYAKNKKGGRRYAKNKNNN